MGTRYVSIHGVNGTAVARGTIRSGGSVVGAAFAFVVFTHLALVAACVALVVVTALLVVRLVRRPRPVAPAAVPARVDDQAARAHRARMATILSR